ncbi:MAG: endonuclease domain-containing protein [Deferrisomatales bacterium]|nr:endonuclease domain-containing protein [Deferrisomatales bacterium]
MPPKPPTPQDILSHARGLRRDATDAERRLWRSLRQKALDGFRFRRQHPVGRFILDFYCHEAKLAIELDGGGHAEESEASRDVRRAAALEEAGVQVLRFWNNEVLGNTEGVLEEIRRHLRRR